MNFGRGAARAFSTSIRVRSHVGSAPIPYPASVTFIPGDGTLTVSSPKGTHVVPCPSFVRLAHSPAPILSSPDTPSTSTAIPMHELSVSVDDSTKKVQRATWGLSRALIANAVTGLTEGFAVPLKLVGVGFRATIEPDPFAKPGTNGQRIKMKLNFAHDVFVTIPEGITASTPQPTRIVLRGTDKQQIGQFAAKIREWRKPEPYKGKVSYF